MLAIDSMEWGLLQRLADRKLMPMLSSLIDGGVCGRLDFPLPDCADSAWSTIASGMLPDRHGVLHALERGMADALCAPTARWSPTLKTCGGIHTKEAT